MADLSRELVEFQRHPSGDGPVAERLARAVATSGAPMVSISLFYDLRSGLSRRLDEPYPSLLRLRHRGAIGASPLDSDTPMGI